MKRRKNRMAAPVAALIVSCLSIVQATTVWDGFYVPAEMWNEDFSGSLNANWTVLTEGSSTVAQTGGQLVFDTVGTGADKAGVSTTSDETGAVTTFNGAPLYDFYDHKVSVRFDIASISGLPNGPNFRNIFYYFVGEADLQDGLLFRLEHLDTGSGPWWRLELSQYVNGTETWDLMLANLNGLPTALTYTVDGTQGSIQVEGASVTAVGGSAGWSGGGSSLSGSVPDLSANIGTYSVNFGAWNLNGSVTSPTVVALDAFLAVVGDGAINSNLTIFTNTGSVSLDGSQMVMDTTTTGAGAQAAVNTQSDETGTITMFEGAKLYNFYNHEVSVRFDIASFAGNPPNSPSKRNVFYFTIGDDAVGNFAPEQGTLDTGLAFRLEHLDVGSGPFWRLELSRFINGVEIKDLMLANLKSLPSALTFRLEGTYASIRLEGTKPSAVGGDTDWDGGGNVLWGSLPDLSGNINGYTLAFGAYNYGGSVASKTVVTLDGFKVDVEAFPVEKSFSTWADSWGPNIGSETNDYDGDRLDNLAEYGTGGNPTDPADQGFLPTFEKVGGAMELVYAQRTEDELFYYLETTTNLVSSPWTNAGYFVTATNVTGGLFDFVTNGIPTIEDQTFARLRIASPRIISNVQMHNGVPTLFVNGQPHNGMAYAAYSPDVEYFRDFTDAGVQIYTFDGTPTEGAYGLAQTTWVAPDTYDYSQFDERIGLILQANPNALILPRLYLHAPAWWINSHPNDVVLMDDNGSHVPYIQEGIDPKKCPSWASETWRQDTVDALGKLIDHVEASSYADRILGYHIASGTTEEWMMWGGNNNGWVDYSPVNIARFQLWLQDKYTTDAALKAAWGDSAVTLATASIPPKTARQAAQYGMLRDPSATDEQAVLDYYAYNSDLVVDTILYFADATKQLTHREKIVGTFYGYLLQLSDHRLQNAGHLALETVLASSDIDFLTSPSSYSFRQVGGAGTSHFMAPLGSVQLHGKLWFDENDIVTSMGGVPYLAIGEFGKTASIAEDILQQKKELANVIVNGTGQWWFDVFSNIHADTDLMASLAGHVDRASVAVGMDRSPVNEVALVIDEKSLTYLDPGHFMGRELLVQQLPALHRLGAPAAHYITADLPQIQDRKMFVIPASFAPDAAQRQAVDALKQGGRVLVFLGVPGLFLDGVIDESAMEDFTGINLKLSQTAQLLKVTINGSHSVIAGLSGTQYGKSSSGTPVCYADDPGATVLGTLPDGKAGLVIKEYADWTAIYSTAPLLPARLLRNIAEEAGVHLWVDANQDEVVWANQNMVSVSVNSSGTRTIHLPQAATVKDFYTGATMGTGITSFSTYFNSKDTRVFVIE